MALETRRNRDLLVKICFMYFLVHILRALGIDEQIEDILPTEKITFENIKEPKIFNHFMDFRVLTKSRKIIIFEFKKDKLTKKDLMQLYRYYNPEFCKDDENTKSIFIVISKGGNIGEYQVSNMRFCPEIIKTKEINKEKDLRMIRDKFENNELLNSFECSLLVAFPIFELGESEDAIVEEMCSNIEDKPHCIPEDELDNVVMGMYLNIVEYIVPEKQEKILEKINMEATTEGVIAGLINQGQKNIIEELLNKYSIEEISDMIDMTPFEIHNIIGDD
jgi:hypothetical protein